MRTQDLEYFTELTRHMHFQKAAAACGISQPTLSVQIQKLEAVLGVSLLQRKNNTLTLSPSGVHLLPQMLAILREADNFLQLAQRLRSRPEEQELFR